MPAIITGFAVDPRDENYVGAYLFLMPPPLEGADVIDHRHGASQCVDGFEAPRGTWRARE